MKNFKCDTPLEATFVQRGLRGYRYPLKLQSSEFYLIESEHGHDDFVKSPDITHLYYVIEGAGVFMVDDERIPVESGSCIEIPPGATFAYSGKMRLLLFMSPPFSDGRVEVVRENPDIPR